MFRIQARVVEQFMCDNVDSLCRQVGYAEEKRVEEDAVVECSESTITVFITGQSRQRYILTYASTDL
jgi:hypothetical protein